MRPALSRVVAVSLCASLCAAARADDGAPAKGLRVPSVWQAGETVTETETISTVTSYARRLADGSTKPAGTSKSSRTSTVVRKCLAADPDGTPTKMLLYVRDWRMGSGAQEDSSLEHAVLELSRDGWRLLTPDMELTPQARAWLTGDLLSPGSSGETAAMDYLPAPGTAVGAEWTGASPGSVAALLQRLGADAETNSAPTRFTLKALTPGDGGDVVRVAHATETSTIGNASIPAAKVRLTGELEGTAGAWHRSLRTSQDSVVEFTYERGGSPLDVTLTSNIACANVAGGEIPSWEPAAGDEDAEVCTFARAAAAPGEVVTEDGADEFTVTTRAEDCACGPCPTPEESSSVEWTLVRRTEEGGAKERVFVKSWTSTGKGAPDTSLAGAFFDVTAEGWKLTGDTVPSDAAKRWIAGRAPAGREPALPYVPMPAAPTRVGAVFMPDTAATAKAALWDAKFEVAPDHATGRCRIVETGADGDLPTAKLRWHTETPLTGSVGEGEKCIRAARGSEVRVSGSASGPLAAWGRIGERRTETQCSVLFEKDGVIRRIATIRKVWLETKPGGEFPEAPK